MWIAASLAGMLGAFALGTLARSRKLPVLKTEDPPSTETAQDERFDRLVRALPLGVLMLDRQSKIVFANRAAAAIFGFEIPRVTGLHLLEAVPSIELERRVDDALEGEASMGPLIITGKTGNRTYGISTYPLVDAADVSSGALILAEDQTELLAMERARQELLSNVSHELRTPLSSVKLMLETVMASPDDETSDLFLPQALAQVDRLANLVKKILDQARADSGDLRLKPELSGIAEVVRPIVQSFEPAARAKGVSLEFRVRNDAQAEVDRDRIAQVVVNLVDNALRFTPEGGSIKVDVDADDTDARIMVKDNGIGIPFKDLPHIFDRFYVVDRSRAREVTGIGLGLAIVKQIVEAHGGTIVAESLLGSGAKFTCAVPLRARNRNS